ncbi:hypothetical protein [Bdellovibrio sp.]|uniref:hypothetical protein n=1 Tax=Bdellovibrio TaxID=958 RepID=UPI0032216A49
MTRLYFLILLTFTVPTLGSASSDIPVGCVGKSTVSEEAYRRWAQAPKDNSASDKISAAPQIEIGIRSALKLKNIQNETRGFVHFQPQDGGDYFVISDFYPRMNILDAENKNASLEARAWGPIRECDTMKKSLRFQLKPKQKYILEVLSRDSDTVNVLIVKAPAQ